MTKFTTKFLLGSAVTLALSLSTQAQTVTLFSENMGTPSANTPIADHVFENDGSVAYSGTADVRASTPSSGYTTASGGGNVWFSSSSTATPDFEISGIDVSLHRSYEVSFGLLKTTNAEDGSNFQIVVSVDGVGVLFENPTLPTGSSTSNAYYYFTYALPAGFGGSDMSISFQKLGGTSGFRVDDVLVEAEEIPLSVKLISFDVKEKNNQTYFTWKTAHEESIAHFEVEASVDGKQYSSLHKVQATNAFNGNTYHLELPSGKHSFFRLKTVHLDNSSEYSQVVKLNKETGSDIQVRNTIVQNEMIIDNVKNNTEFRVINMAGQTVQKGLLHEGNNVVNMSALQAGNYILTTNQSKVQFSKL